ncbi:MAG: NAD/FAD-binding protein [Hirschia sp.]|nr:NAD/FAD-binding protein [Hirschia sp.]MBF19998.1 NAD/FAD-binding protein [Hirschia sp.]
MPFTASPSQQRIAIIGGGISGLGAAFALKDSADVTLFEKRERLGGHACTIDVDYDGSPLSVDIGFIVCNDHNYRNFVPLMQHLGVDLVDSDMSFAVSDPAGFEWSSDRRGLFAWKRNAFNPTFLGLLREIMRFNARARADIASNSVPDYSLGDYLDELGVSKTFRDNYLLPMGAAIWSTPERGVLDYPAESFIRFFDNHRLMHMKRPVWRTVKGGSREYVSKMAALLDNRIRLNAPVERITPGVDGKVEVALPSGERQLFDEVILAGHSDQSDKMLSPIYRAQKAALGMARYAPNIVYVHRDPSLMPRRRAAWASWNVMRGQGETVCVSYWMNRLQSIPNSQPLFVTLNPKRPPHPDLTFHTTQFDHPMFDADAQQGRDAVRELQGQDGLWFAGAWLGDGFHEAGLKSGLATAFALGGAVPWTPFGVERLSPPAINLPRMLSAETHA